MIFKSYKKAEEHAILSINGDEKIGYIILSGRRWFRKYYYINYYFKTVIADYES